MIRFLSALAGVTMLLPHANAEPLVTPPLLAPAPAVNRPAPSKPVDAAKGKAGPLLTRKKTEGPIIAKLRALCGFGPKAPTAPRPAATPSAAAKGPATQPLPPAQPKKPPGSTTAVAAVGAKTGPSAPVRPAENGLYQKVAALLAKSGPAPEQKISAIAAVALVPRPAPAQTTPARTSTTPANTSVPEITAANIKQNESAAGARRAAVRYLGTVDSHYYPEAEEALLATLRCDRNEKVRLEAALALGNGLCYSRRTVQTLQLAISGGCTDNNPSETSARVKTAAFASLQKCLARGGAARLSEPADTPAPQPYSGSASSRTNLQPIRHTEPSPEQRKKTEDAIAAAWRMLAENVSAPEANSRPVAAQQGLLHVMVATATRHPDTPSPEERPSTPRQTTGRETVNGLNSLGLAPIGRIPAQP